MKYLKNNLLFEGYFIPQTPFATARQGIRNALASLKKNIKELSLWL